MRKKVTTMTHQILKMQRAAQNVVSQNLRLLVVQASVAVALAVPRMMAVIHKEAALRVIQSSTP